MEVNLALAVVVPSVTVIVWLVRLEGRVNGHDDMVRGLRDDVKYIRSHVDSFLNRSHHTP